MAASVGDIVIRPFDPDCDSQRIREITAEIWSGGGSGLMEMEFGTIGGRPWSEWQSDSVLSYFGGENAQAFVAELDGEVIGFCSYVIDSVKSIGTVGYNGVAKAHQCKGYGSLMLDFVMEGIRAAGMSYANVIVADNDAHAPARANYEKHGFHKLLGFQEMVQKL